MIIVLERNPKKTHPSETYSTALPAWLSAANLGIGVGGLWGRIARDRCESGNPFQSETHIGQGALGLTS